MDKLSAEDTSVMDLQEDKKPVLEADVTQATEPTQMEAIPAEQVQEQTLEQPNGIQIVLSEDTKMQADPNDAQEDPSQAVNYSMIQAGQLAEGEYGTVVNGQQIQPYPTGMLAATVPQTSSYSMQGTQQTGWMMDGMGTPAAEIPPASTILNGQPMTRALTLGYGSQTTTFYQMPTYSQYGVGFMYVNTWEGEPADENTPPGKHGNYIVTADHRQFHILASISDSRVGQIHLLNPGDNDPTTALKVMQNTIPNHYRSAVHYVHKMFVCEFVDKKFYVQACEVGAEKFQGGTSTLAWTNALHFYCPQRTSCRLSGPLYFGFAISAVQELCPGLKYQPRKTGVRTRRHSQNYPEGVDSEGAEGMQTVEAMAVAPPVVMPEGQLTPQTLVQMAPTYPTTDPAAQQVINTASLATAPAYAMPLAAAPQAEQLDDESMLSEGVKRRGGE